MESIEQIDDVIGFKKLKNETIEGEVKTESDQKMLAILLMVIGIIVIIIDMALGLYRFIGMPIVAMVGVLLVVVGFYVWFFYRKSFRVIVTSMRIVEEFFAKRFKQGLVRDYHYRFFESIEVAGNTKDEQAHLRVHLSSGEELFYILPKDLISAIVEHSRMFVGVQ